MRRIRFPGLLSASVLVSGMDGATAVKLAWERERLLHENFPGKAGEILKILEQDFTVEESTAECVFTLRPGEPQ